MRSSKSAWSSKARFCLICACPKSCQYPAFGALRSLKKVLELALGWDGFVVLAVFNADPDAFLRCVAQESRPGIPDARRAYAPPVALATFHGLRALSRANSLLRNLPSLDQFAQVRSVSFKARIRPVWTTTTGASNRSAMSIVCRVRRTARSLSPGRCGGELVAVRLIDHHLRGSGQKLCRLETTNGILLPQLEASREAIGALSPCPSSMASNPRSRISLNDLLAGLTALRVPACRKGQHLSTSRRSGRQGESPCAIRLTSARPAPRATIMSL